MTCEGPPTHLELGLEPHGEEVMPSGFLRMSTELDAVLIAMLSDSSAK